MDKILPFIKEKKYLGIIGNAIVIVSLFLPLVTVSASFLGISHSESLTYFSAGKGVILLILAIVSLLMIFADKLQEKVPFFAKLVNPKLTLIPTAITAILFIIDVSQVASSGVSGLSSLVNVSYGIGFWLLIVGLVACAAYPFLYKGENK